MASVCWTTQVYLLVFFFTTPPENLKQLAVQNVYKPYVSSQGSYGRQQKVCRL